MLEIDAEKGAVQVAARRRRGKKRSGWKHPLDLNRNRRRCEKRRRSASAVARHAIEEFRAAEAQLELREAADRFQVLCKTSRAKRRFIRRADHGRGWAPSR